MSREENEQFLKEISTTELDSGVMPRDVFDEFVQELQKESNILDQVRTETLPRQKMTIPKLSVGERKRVAQEEGSSVDTTQVSTSGIDIDAEKGAVYWELTREAVEDVSDQQIADKVMEMMAQQFSIDTTDLGFVGQFDDEAEESQTGEEIGRSADGTEEYELWLEHAPIQPESLAITYKYGSGSEGTVTDDGDGNLQGDAEGTIDYESGFIDIDLDEDPDDDEPIEADYDVKEFALQNEGWVRLALDRDSPTVDAEEGDLDLELFHNTIQAMESKYLRTDPILMVNKSQWQEFLWDTADQREGLGDAIISGEDDVNPFGYDVLPSSVIPKHKALFTPPDNLIYAIWKEVEVNTLTESDDIHDRDLYAKYKITARDDFQIEESDAVVVIENLAIE